MNDLKQMKQLINIINEHNHRYYALDDPIISDQEYDATFKKLLELEKNHKTLTKYAHNYTCYVFEFDRFV